MPEPSLRDLLMGGPCGKGRKREEAGVAPGVVNGEGAMISALITSDHQSLVGAGVKKERRGKCG